MRRSVRLNLLRIVYDIFCPILIGHPTRVTPRDSNGVTAVRLQPLIHDVKKKTLEA
jgi:hypothetical protein